MSADTLKKACLTQMELLAAEAATAQANISIAQSVEQIALQTAYHKGIISGAQRASEAITREYKKLTQPESNEKKTTTRELY